MTDTSTRIAGPTQQPNQLNPIMSVDALPGMAMRSDTLSATGEGRATPALGDSAADGRVIGIMLRNGAAGEGAPVIFAGPVDLTTAEWDAIAGTTGGLAEGVAYYLSQATAGHLLNTAPGSGVIMQVGIALSPTTLLVQLRLASSSA